MMKRNIRIAGALVGVVLSGQVSAATTATTMPVTAVTVNACAVVASPLVFGTLNQLGGATNDSQTSLVVTCTPGTSYNVGLDNGAHAVGGTRYMDPAIGTGAIPYALYSDAARTTAWGNTVGTNTVANVAAVLPATLTVYGRIPGNATPGVGGAYSDLVTVTVTF